MALRWLIYGAYGYSGQLITHQAKRRGYTPLLAGRDAQKLNEFANQVSLQARPFDLNDSHQVASQLNDVDLVVNCAGPFSETAASLIEACLASHTHYLDITGEIEVFEYAHQQHARALEAGIVICPGVGFDVIPTDCVAARLNAQLPGATWLRLGFDSKSRMSRGTSRTSLQRLSKGGAIRENGVIKDVPLAYQVDTIDFGNGLKMAMTIPWGDVATAYYTTEIPNISVFVPASPKLVRRLKWLNWVRWLFRFDAVKKQLLKRVDKQDAGPSANERDNNPTYVWGEIGNAKGHTQSLRVKVKNGYSVTAEGAVELAVYTLQHDDLKGGYYTPARLYGAKLLDRFIIE
ncbi:saccharopine dehydrogenase family protein [Idiomarina xiamenensis]|uniref:Saccharopine dehydrogenase NADP binding domain-containing protein n=1 Tax=Idiomarina xiamenensis 10-D-4 TaxID=740709 RepID=K2KWI8_9GAMM|nr:saccharopine dehydrogenase NADP-binding domain-containing protein [Idiomarina xiamenensis]EKE86844.1 hypothetical protein A10D4_01342 [Idiomarina xiamenensis 10-D-4]